MVPDTISNCIFKTDSGCVEKYKNFLEFSSFSVHYILVPIKHNVSIVDSFLALESFLLGCSLIYVLKLTLFALL